MDISCVCPPLAGDKPRHPDGDRIELRERLDFRACLTIRNSVAVLKRDDPDSDEADILSVLTEQYIVHGIESWTIVDKSGEAIEPTKPAIREFLEQHPEAAYAIGDEADERYMEQVMLPLLRMASTSSPPGPTEPSTSQPTGSPSEAPTPSRPSLITTSPTDDTDATSPLPDGDSKSSRRSRSVA